MALSHCGDNFTSLGSKGLKIWNNDFEVFYLNNDIINGEPKNAQLDPACKFVFNINGAKVEIFNRFENRSLPPIKIDAREHHFRKILFANDHASFYVADDGTVIGEWVNLSDRRECRSLPRIKCGVGINFAISQTRMLTRDCFVPAQMRGPRNDKILFMKIYFIGQKGIPAVYGVIQNIAGLSWQV